MRGGGPRCRSAPERLPAGHRPADFDEVAEAYLTAEQAVRVQAGNSTLVRDFRLPYTSHRRAEDPAEDECRAVTGWDR
ncbi:hypothetical protein ACWDN9_29355, partial [Streptomyces nigra]